MSFIERAIEPCRARGYQRRCFRVAVLAASLP